MNLSKLSAGRDVPKDVNVVIEIPTHADPVKYEVDKDSGALFVDRFMSTSMVYPCNYGFIPQTLSEDGDPVDVLVVTPVPLAYGSVIRSRPIGMLQMTDEAGVDAKILAVPVTKMTQHYNNVQEPKDLPAILLDTIAHFFEHYKDLEKDKWVKVDAWLGCDAAKQEILASVQRYQKTQSE